MTIAELIKTRAGDSGNALFFEDQKWTWKEFVQTCAQRAAFLLDHHDKKQLLHVGILMDNIPEFPMWAGATAVAGGVVVGLNSTRKGDDLIQNITHTDCRFLIIEKKYYEELGGLDTGIRPENILVVDSAEYPSSLAPYKDAELPDREIKPEDIFMLVFTSGTSGAPKAVICSHGRVASSSKILSQMLNLTDEDVSYVVMPFFHSNPIILGWVPTLVTGGAMALRRKFSASGFLPDIRKYNATFFSYVGKPLSYILATPEKPDDADNPLVCCLGNEASDRDIDEFARRFDCHVTDAYGSTEGGASIARTSDMPKGSLGVAGKGTFVMDPVTEKECPRAKFDANGKLLNADEAIGELVNQQASFEGYWKNEEANKARMKGGIFRTGDLAYRDEQGYFYFAGRDIDWMRVDGENLGASQVEAIILRRPEVEMAAVYAVPDPNVGDRVMATLKLKQGADFDCNDFISFLKGQKDFGTKWAPSFIRLADQLPITPTNKIIKRQLQKDLWLTGDPVYWQKERTADYALMSKDDVAEFEQEFQRCNRGGVLDRGL
jgi:fatty-acyl-CoA synthase